jgi:glycosyltransferase involved in cell wall biosynthesis
MASVSQFSKFGIFKQRYQVIKIIYVVTGLATGGAEIMLYHLLCQINRDRFTPIVISLMDRGTLGDRIEALDIPVHTLNMTSTALSLPLAALQLIQITRQIQPDLIQGWMYHGNLAAQIASRFLPQQSPTLWDIQCSLYSLAFEKKLTALVIQIGARLSRSAFQVIHVSRVGKSQHEALGYDCHNGCVIPNGIDTSLFIPSTQARLTLRKELGLSETATLIGLICRYHPMKDHANFIQAAALLLKTHPDVYFILAGKDVDANNPPLFQLIQQLGLTNRVYLLGERRDTPQLIAALDIACSASSYGEGCPLVVEEAMSCGVPCVVTEVGDSGWVVGETGRVVPPANPTAFAQACKDLIDLDTEGRQVLGKQARQRIIESFSLEFVVAEYEQLYERALA